MAPVHLVKGTLASSRSSPLIADHPERGGGESTISWMSSRGRGVDVKVRRGESGHIALTMLFGQDMSLGQTTEGGISMLTVMLLMKEEGECALLYARNNKG